MNTSAIQNTIRLKQEENHFQKINSFFDSTISSIIISHVSESFEKQISETIESTFIPITKTAYSKKILNITKDAMSVISIPGNIQLFMEESNTIYARTFPTSSIDTTNYIVLSSSLLSSFTDNELRFVLGHEISHILFEHAVTRWILETIYPDNQALPPYILNEVNIWLQLAEISADRAGLAVCGNIEASISALRKINSIKLPPTSIRTECLQSEKAFIAYYSELIKQPKDTYSILFISFLKAAGQMIGMADGNFSKEERNYILNKLSRYGYIIDEEEITNTPVRFKDIIKTGKEIQEKYPEKILELFINLGILTLRDNKLSTEEYSVLERIGLEALGLNKNQIVDLFIKIIRSQFFTPYNEK